jgi:hypothetical protein
MRRGFAVQGSRFRVQGSGSDVASGFSGPNQNPEPQSPYYFGVGLVKISSAIEALILTSWNLSVVTWFQVE